MAWGVKLGQWCENIRSAKKGITNHLLTDERIKQLDEMGFIWDTYKYRFENNAKAVAEYYEKYGKYPVTNSKNLEIKKLGDFINYEKIKMRDEDIIYPEWKIEILEKYLPDFSCETRNDKEFKKFIYYTKLYKKRYGHVDIKSNDKIDGYNIGSKRITLSRCKSLSESKIKELENLGVYLGNKIEKQFDETIRFAKQAVKDGVIISSKNSKYKEKNLYIWIMGTIKNRYRNKKLSTEEIQSIEKLIGKSLDELYCGKKPIKTKVIDINENRAIGIFESQKEAVRVIRDKYNIKITDKVVRNRLTGKVTTPYMDRFMFYRVDEKGEVTE